MHQVERADHAALATNECPLGGSEEAVSRAILPDHDLSHSPLLAEEMGPFGQHASHDDSMRTLPAEVYVPDANGTVYHSKATPWEQMNGAEKTLFGTVFVAGTCGGVISVVGLTNEFAVKPALTAARRAISIVF